MLTVAKAWSSSDSNARCYILPVLLMMSCFHIVGRIKDDSFVQFARWQQWGQNWLSRFPIT